MNSDEAQTKPTLETILERINELKTDVGEVRTDVRELRTDVRELRIDVRELRTEIGDVRTDVGEIKTNVGGLRNEFQLFRGEMEIRIDRIEGMTNMTRSEMLELRADFRDWKAQLNGLIKS